MKKYILVLTISVLVGFFSSCKHQPDPVPSAPVIIVNEPESGLYNNGDTIFMQANLSDEDELHEAFICVRDTVDTMFSFSPTVHALSSYDVDTFWVVSGISVFTPGFVSYKAANHSDKESIINVAISLAP